MKKTALYLDRRKEEEVGRRDNENNRYIKQCKSRNKCVTHSVKVHERKYKCQRKQMGLNMCMDCLRLYGRLVSPWNHLL